MKNTQQKVIGEKAEYEWACQQCRKMFTPRRLKLPGGVAFQRICSTCGLKNLEKFLKDPATLE